MSNLNDFCQTNPNDSQKLVFTVSLTTEQRARVHEIAPNYSLQHFSSGSEVSRFLTIARSDNRKSDGSSQHN